MRWRRNTTRPWSISKAVGRDGRVHPLRHLDAGIDALGPSPFRDRTRGLGCNGSGALRPTARRVRQYRQSKVMCHGLTEAQKREYRQNGFLLCSVLLLTAALILVNSAIDELVLRAKILGEGQTIVEYEADPADGRRPVWWLFNPFEQHDAFRTIATDDRLLDLVESLVGPNIALQHSKLNMKAARVGAAVEWHQDLTYFPHTNDDLFGARLLWTMQRLRTAVCRCCLASMIDFSTTRYRTDPSLA